MDQKGSPGVPAGDTMTLCTACPDRAVTHITISQTDEFVGAGQKAATATINKGNGWGRHRRFPGNAAESLAWIVVVLCNERVKQRKGRLKRVSRKVKMSKVRGGEDVFALTYDDDDDDDDDEGRNC